MHSPTKTDYEFIVSVTVGAFIVFTVCTVVDAIFYRCFDSTRVRSGEIVSLVRYECK